MLLFDFDGTLVDDFEMVYSLWREFADALGKKISRRKFREKNNPQWQDFVKDAFGVRVNNHEKLFKKIIISEYRKRIVNEKMVSEIKKYLQNQNFSIVTSGFSTGVKKVVKKEGLHPRIIVSSEETGTSDKKYLIKHALKKVKAEYYVGDTEQDIRAAHSNKLRTIAVTWGFQSRNRLLKAKPEHLVSNPKELVELLRTLKNE